MVDIVDITSGYVVIGVDDGEVEDVVEMGELRRFRRVRGRRRGGVVEGLGSGGTGSFFQTKSFGGGGSIAMLANGGQALSSCPSGLTLLLAASEVRMVA